MYHLYHDYTFQRPGIPPGAGSHPSDAWLAQQGYHRVANLPQAPSAGMVWQASTPPYALVDGVSTPQGQWVVDDTPQPPQRYSKLRLYEELTALALWDTFEATLNQYGKWRAFDLAQDLSSDHPDFQATKELLTGILDVDAEAVLEHVGIIMGRVKHHDTQRMLAWLLAHSEPYFTVTVRSASAPFIYSFTPYITAGESFWVDWGDGNEDTYTTASSSEKTHEYANSGTYTIRMLGSAGIKRVRISPTNAERAALVIDSNGNLDKLGTITSTYNMFRACPNLAMTKLTGGITSIDNEAFYGCTSLALTSLPEGVTTINYAAFQSCTSLALTSLPEGVTNIGTYAFRYCTNLALTSLPEDLTNISTQAFLNCTSLALTSLPEGVTDIGENAFRGCTNLALTSLPEGVTSISYRAFSGCTNLALTSLPEGVTDIGNEAFGDCTSLALTSLPEGVTTIDRFAFLNCPNLALTSLPEGVTTINTCAFEGCTNLALTSLPESVTTLDMYAFHNCTKLALTSLPESVTTIVRYAFKGCTSLALTSLPANVTSIGENAFEGCTGLTDLVFLGTPTHIAPEVFSTSGANLFVPWSYGAVAYAPWGAASVTYGYTSYFTVTVQSASAPFNYSFTPYITAGESFSVDWGDGNGDTYTAASTAEKTHEYANSGTYTIRMLGSAGINQVKISPMNLGRKALVIGSNGNLDKLGTITDTTNMFRVCPNLAMTELTGGITSIDEEAFYGCSNITLTSLPEGVTSIGINAFTSCIDLALTSLPEGVTDIGLNAFLGCTSLALTSLPEGVTAIGINAFYGCKGLTDLIFLGTPTGIGSDAFTLSGANLYVPWSSGAVAGAPWGPASVTYDYAP